MTEEAKQEQIEKLWKQHEMSNPKIEVVKLRGRLDHREYYALKVTLGVEQSFILRMIAHQYCGLEEAGLDVEHLLQSIAGRGQ